MSDTATCPFCGYQDPEPAVLLHIELQHTSSVENREGRPFDVPDEVWEEAELEAPSDVRQKFDDSGWTEYAECPIEDCGEIVSFDNIDSHLDLHLLEQAENEPEELQPSIEDSKSDSPKLPSPTLSPVASTVPSKEPGLSIPGTSSTKNWKQLLSLSTPKSSAQPSEMSGVLRVKKVKKAKNAQNSWHAHAQNAVRLGKDELGAHHNEDRMPDWLYNRLKKHGFRSSRDTIPVIAQLLEKGTKTQYAYLCDPATQHISKLSREGGFCGYRNIQMLVSYIINSGAPGAAIFKSTIPDIFEIQDLIEKAWDAGINPSARKQVGVLRRTRKYIGTAEAQVFFHYLGIPHREEEFVNLPDDMSRKAEIELYDHVENYFATAPGVDSQSKVRNTARAPIYFQHRGHSMTIIGIERTVNGNRNLLVFDPSYGDPVSVTRYVGRHVERPNEDALKMYRRGAKYMGHYKQFEILRLE
ncbi:DUF1671-domain-containing protein [Hypoxylon sp. NC0597]|nr:DUF1671-domain-containing protein [Hypoxylon sp. NC0597]